MRVLAIDGAFGKFTCAVGVDCETKGLQSVEGGATLESGLDAIRRALDEAGAAGHNVDRIAVCTGPGSFTGLRIAISFAKSLAQGWRKPLVGISAFDVLELGVSAVPRLAVICAREGIISVRLTLDDARLTQSGPISSVCAWVEQHSPGKEMTAIDATEDVLSALGERGKLVQNLQLTAPVLALVELAETRVPVRSVHAVRPDYGEIPPVRPAPRSR